MNKHPLYNHTGLVKNNKSHIIYALADKQIELKQLENEYLTKITKIKADLTALETTICLFDNNCDETIDKINNSIKSNKKRLFKNGELRSLILDIIKNSDKNLSNKNIAMIMLETKPLDITVSELSKKVKDCCKVLSQRGIIKNASERNETVQYYI